MTDLIVLGVGALALLLSALGGWPLTSGVLRLAARSRDAGGGPSRDRSTGPVLLDPPDDGPVGQHARAALRGGTWIGILERVAITTCLLAGYPAGIAFVVAVKGLGRYPELRENPGVSERFVIGTLASMLWAVAVGALAHGLPLD